MNGHFDRFLPKLTSGREFAGGSEKRTGVYTEVHEDSFPEPTPKLPAEAEFGKGSYRKKGSCGIVLIEFILIYPILLFILSIIVEGYNLYRIKSRIDEISFKVAEWATLQNLTSNRAMNYFSGAYVLGKEIKFQEKGGIAITLCNMQTPSSPTVINTYTSNPLFPSQIINILNNNNLESLGNFSPIVVVEVFYNYSPFIKLTGWINPQILKKVVFARY